MVRDQQGFYRTSSSLAHRQTGGAQQQRSTRRYSQAQDAYDSGDDVGTVRASASGGGFGLGGGGGGSGRDGVDAANATTLIATASAQQAAAVEAMDRASRSASNSASKASIVASSHGRSLRQVAQAILDGDTNVSDAQTLLSYADTLERFADAVGRTAGHVETAREYQEAHHATLEATGGGRGDGEESKSYSLAAGSGGRGGRHAGRYRSATHDYSQASSFAGGGGGLRSVGY